MCGIFGYLRLLSGAKCLTPQQIYEAFEAIRSRGPDRSTFHEISEYDQMIYLGFQRLAIMDPTTDGDQPFTLEHKVYKNGKDDKDGKDDNDSECSKTDQTLQEHRSVYVICNGEIYNHLELIDQNGYRDKMIGRSDCEFLPRYYVDHGIEKLSNDLRGEFALAVFDIDRVHRKMTIHLVRDALSVRPIFIGIDERGFGFCSEAKGLTNIIDQTSIRQLRGGRRYEVTIDVDTHAVSQREVTYFDLHQYEREVNDVDDYSYEVTDMLRRIYPDLTKEKRLEQLENVLTAVRETFERVVISVLQSDVPLGALLSGGLDSSLVVAIAAKHLRRYGKRLRTFSVGIPGATDREYAEMVAAHCGTDHTHVEFSNDEFMAVIPHVIKAIESYDITTVRASAAQYLIAKWIRENTDIRVLTQGDGSDEALMGYLYWLNAESPNAGHNETIFRLSDIGIYDALRSDRGIASNGVEARTPFLHRDFIECIISIDSRLKVPLSDTGLRDSRCNKRKEKWLLRKAFDVEYTDHDGATATYLPDAVMWRQKEAFSDGCSSKEKSWYEIVQESIEELYTDDDIACWAETLRGANTQCVPRTKEAVHYLGIFTKHYGNAYQLIPYYWMPKWCGNATDPSARTLDVYGDSD